MLARTTGPTTAYRAEIDGLRALAVLAVVLYHARLPGLSSGFVGVDVFFAISGYVVMGTLAREQQASGGIDWPRFLARRARRLLPLLTVTVAASLVVGSYLLRPLSDFQDLVGSAIAGMGMSANLYSWWFADSYFAPQQEQWPLMHLWSLSVEEQFYLMLPLLFLLSRWLPRPSLVPLLAIATLGSFLLAAYGGWAHPEAAFYLPFTRAWEFGVGALAAVPRTPTLVARPWVISATLAGIIVCFLIIEPQGRLSTLASGIPAAFTALLLWASAAPQTASFASVRFLSQGWLRWIGLRSYAWYLLHWPLQAYYRSYWLEDVSWGELALVSGAALLLASAAHRWVELPCRYARLPTKVRPAHILVLAVALITSTQVLSLTLANRALDRQSDPRWAFAEEFEIWEREIRTTQRQFAAESTQPRSQSQSQLPTTILWGDSHAFAYLKNLRRASVTKGHSVRAWALAGCPPLANWNSKANWGLNSKRMRCKDFTRNALRDIEITGQASPTTVVLAARWAAYMGMPSISAGDRVFERKIFAGVDREADRQLFAESLRSTVKQLLSYRVNVILVASIPEQGRSIPACLARFTPEQCQTPRALVDAHRRASLDLLQDLAALSPSVQVVDPIDAFCDDQTCTAGPPDRPWYIDDDHASQAGSDRMLPFLSHVLDQRHQTQLTLSSPPP